MQGNVYVRYALSMCVYDVHAVHAHDDAGYDVCDVHAIYNVCYLQEKAM